MTTHDRSGGSQVRPPLQKGDDGSANVYPPRVIVWDEVKPVTDEQWDHASSLYPVRFGSCCCRTHAGANVCPDCPEHGTVAVAEGTATCDLCGKSDDYHSHDADEYGFGEGWSSIEDYDRQRDDELTDRFSDYGPATGDPRS